MVKAHRSHLGNGMPTVSLQTPLYGACTQCGKLETMALQMAPLSLSWGCLIIITRHLGDVLAQRD